ncbi:hypothetical protein E2C01_000747 [Portunus trituberculatus]|uniref:Uncharacterized protein n=1 Tax=Portunus trituberculatus TaxID=210409 RepID=A0A5B7CFX3_PORTR|nr:hypothetical protein [Portunus trituberculatus]
MAYLLQSPPQLGLGAGVASVVPTYKLTVPFIQSRQSTADLTLNHSLDAPHQSADTLVLGRDITTGTGNRCVPACAEGQVWAAGALFAVPHTHGNVEYVDMVLEMD